MKKHLPLSPSQKKRHFTTTVRRYTKEADWEGKQRRGNQIDRKTNTRRKKEEILNNHGRNDTKSVKRYM